jgi:N-acetylneuraminic acid mutarotase
MIRFAAFVLLVGCAGPASAPATPARDGEWQVRADIPKHVYGHAGAVVGGKVHTLGGCPTPDWTDTDAAHQVYDPAADRWTKAADLPIELGWPMVAVHENRIYVFGGMRDKAVSTNKAWVYDPAADKWSPIRDLPAPAMNGFAVAFGKHIYVGLGYNRQGRDGKDIKDHYKTLYRYDPAADAYEKMADAPECGCYAAAGVWNGAIYVVHGAEIEIGWHHMNEYAWADGALKYVPAANAWTKLPAKRGCKRVFYLTQCASTVSRGPEMFIAGGLAEKRGRTTTCEIFDMAKEEFRPMPPMPQMRCCGGGGVVGDSLVITGGFFGTGDLGNVCKPTWVYKVK